MLTASDGDSCNDIYDTINLCTLSFILQTSDALLPTRRQHACHLRDAHDPGLSLSSGFRERRRHILSGGFKRNKVQKI